MFGVISCFEVLEVADDCSINLHYCNNLCSCTVLITFRSIQDSRKSTVEATCETSSVE